MRLRHTAIGCRSANRASGAGHASQVLFLRVGMDLGFGRLGPLFADGRFEYVPTPESPKNSCSRSVLFSQMSARSGGTIDRFVSLRYRVGPAHYDPEFETFTYGDPTRNKRAQLLSLARGNILVFYAGLRAPSSDEAHVWRAVVRGRRCTFRRVRADPHGKYCAAEAAIRSTPPRRFLPACCLLRVRVKSWCWTGPRKDGPLPLHFLNASRRKALCRFTRALRRFKGGDSRFIAAVPDGKDRKCRQSRNGA